MHIQDGKNVEALFTGDSPTPYVISQEEFKKEVIKAAHGARGDFKSFFERAWKPRQRQLSPNPAIQEGLAHKDYMIAGLAEIRLKLRPQLDMVMERVRKYQLDNPRDPKKNLFARNLLSSIDESLDDVCDIDDGERYDLRFFSSADTILDYAGGFDCWVELVDLKIDRVLKTVKIDITINPEKHSPGQMADAVLYVDPKYADASAKGKISPDFFQSNEYIKLVRIASQMIEESGVVVRPT